jgi:multidrug resistance efflux pump
MVIPFKTMIKATRLISLLFILGPLASNLLSSPPSSCKKEDENATKAEKKEKKDEKEKPKTVEPKKKHIRIQLSLKGYFEDPDAVAFSIATKSWAELKVVTPPVQGKKVKKGDSLLALDLEKIKQRLDSLKSELSLSSLNGQILSSEVKLAETLAPIEMEALARKERQAKEDYDRFRKIELPYEKKSETMALKSYEQTLSYVTEELNQLKKMYEADDLTEETEEIILQRTQNQVDRAQFSLEGAKKRNEEFNKISLPRKIVDKEKDFDRKKLSMSTLRKTQPIELKKKRLELEKMEEERNKLLKTKKELEFDLKQMTPHSPVAGILYWGTFKKGKWSGTTIFETKLRKAGMIKPYEEFLTIVPHKRTHVRIQLPEKNLDEIRSGMKGTIQLPYRPDEKLDGRLLEISQTPINPGIYDLTVFVTIPEGEKLPLPGTACSLKVVTYEKKDALTLPSSAIFSEEADPDTKFIYLVSNKGKPKKKNVEVGKKSGDDTEILSGVRIGNKVLAEKPKP